MTLNMIFAQLLLLLKAINKEEVVSTDLVIGVGSRAELGDRLEVRMSGMLMVKISIK